MKILIIVSLIVGLVSCKAQENNKKKVTLYFAKGDFIYYYEGEVKEASELELNGNINDAAFLNKIVVKVKEYQKIHKKDSIIVKPISTGADYSAFIDFFLKLGKEGIENLSISTKLNKQEANFFELSEEEMNYFNTSDFSKVQPLYRPTTIEIITPTIVNTESENKNFCTVEFEEERIAFYYRDSLYKDLNNKKGDSISIVVKEFIKKFKINNSFNVFLKAKANAPFKLIDKVMAELAKNDVDQFKLVTQKD